MRIAKDKFTTNVFLLNFKSSTPNEQVNLSDTLAGVK